MNRKKIIFVNFHPVDSQIVKHTAKKLKNKGYKIKFLFAEKEGIIEKIIKQDGFEYKKIGRSDNSGLKKIVSSIILEINLF